jgi:hypothetical protein
MMYEYAEPWQNDIDRRKLKNSERKNCPIFTLSTTNPTWTELSLHGVRLATNCLSYGTALWEYLFYTTVVDQRHETKCRLRTCYI